MMFVTRHAKTGVYWIRRDYPRHLQSILGKKAYPGTLGTKDKTIAHAQAPERLAAVQRRIDDAETIWNTQQSGAPAEVSLTLPVGISLIEVWQENEPPRVCRRLFGLSQAARAGSSSVA